MTTREQELNQSMVNNTRAALSLMHEMYGNITSINMIDHYLQSAGCASLALKLLYRDGKTEVKQITE